MNFVSASRTTHITTPIRRLVVLSALAVPIGLLGGASAWVLLHLIRGITNLALFHRLSWQEASLATLNPGPEVILVAVVGAAIVSAIALWAPSIRGHGIPETMESIVTKQSRITPRVGIAKPLATAIAIGTGGPFGAEGPIIVTGGALGSLIGQVIPVSPSERKILLAAGAAAGMAATFGAPLAAVVLALELLLFEFSTRAFVPLVVASSIAGAVHIALLGSGPLFKVPPHDFASPLRLPLYALVGVIAGLLALVITKGLSFWESAFERLPVSVFWHPLIGAVGFAGIGMFVPRVLGVGYDSIGDVLTGRLAVGTLVILLLAKLFAWWIALGSGTSGGTLAPMLLISGALGGLVGHAFHSVNAGISPGAIAVIMMAATFGAATRATFTSIVFLFELTRDYRIVLPLMLASVIADVIMHSFSRYSLFTEKLGRRGVTIGGDYEVDVLRVMHVRDVMTSDVVTLSSDATIGEALDLWRDRRHGAYPIVDEEGRCVGIVTRGDLLNEDVDDSAPVLPVASREVVTAYPHDTLLHALEGMLEEEVDHLPVIEGERLIGICTRGDLFKARRRQLLAERQQPGLIERRKGRTTQPT
jgi:H+/Cl- antiporter ClcA